MRASSTRQSTPRARDLRAEIRARSRRGRGGGGGGGGTSGGGGGNALPPPPSDVAAAASRVRRTLPASDGGGGAAAPPPATLLPPPPSSSASRAGLPPRPSAASDALVAAEASRGLGSGEARFSYEVPLEGRVAWWHDKYKPRKPKYYNRVHTGYDWNKYNKTHYDYDNPPPKQVQGYKFAVFYPDLIDRSTVPSYQILPDPDAGGSNDTCLLKFKGGPPYEDLAFRIVAGEWETSHKRGFKCRFERGVLQLHFGFKRLRYRR